MDLIAEKLYNKATYLKQLALMKEVLKISVINSVSERFELIFSKVTDYSEDVHDQIHDDVYESVLGFIIDAQCASIATDSREIRFRYQGEFEVVSAI